MSSTNIPAGPKDVFLHLLGIGTLYFSVVNFLILVFQYVNHLFPDPAAYIYGANLDSVRFSTASLIIVFPVYLLLSWLLQRDIRAFPEKANIWIRKWLLYFTLFIAAVTIIIDLVVLVNSFLGGELTVRFLLKVLVILATAATVFGYYLWDLRRSDFVLSRKPRAFAIGTAAVVLASVVAGFFIVGSPFYQRQLRLDSRRIEHLSGIQGQIIDYWRTKEQLPAALGDLQNDISGFVPPTDPVTGDAYEYRSTGRLTFELCATFETASPERQDRNYPRYEAAGQENWKHGEGRSCFSRTIDPDMYAPYAKPVIR
ncbi:MAG: DUF5671 domain-containing protein [Candidatus Peribacteraceae bacterium]|nr:DUF5671 domain-containing protein [Candidatus Peribacteraceae bacterium]